MSERAAAEVLAARPSVAMGALAEACPHGVHVARIRRGRHVRCDGPWSKKAEALAVQPPMTLMTRALLVLAAVATGAGLESDGSIRFDLGPAGAWREAVEGRWFHTGAGRHWFSWHPDRLTQ